MVYPDSMHVEPVQDLAVEVAGPNVLATLVLPVGQARSWAGELFAAVAVAYREATGDPHALSDFELANLSPANDYHPGGGVLVQGDDDRPARVRFHIGIDIDGICLSTGALRADLVEALTERFNTARVAVSEGGPRAGQVR